MFVQPNRDTNLEWLKSLTAEETAAFLQKVAIDAVSDYLQGKSVFKLAPTKEWLLRKREGLDNDLVWGL